MPAKFIKVDNGVTTQVYQTEADTIGALFTASFREDFNIGSRASATINGIAVSDDTPLNANDTVGYRNVASSKS